MTGVPIYNINNNGATGATAIQLAFSLINGGVYSSVLAFGFEKMEKGSLKVYFNDRTQPTAKFVLRSAELFPSKLA
jgi:acetyl-CoA acyltransferase